jgi:Acetyltransferase (GNAT) domain
MVNYHDGHIRSKRVDIGYIVNPSRRREGIGAEAVLAMVQFCFGDLGTHRVQAFIHPHNAASRELVEKLGFRCEVASVTIYAWVTNGATTCCMRCSQPSAPAKLDLTPCAADLNAELKSGRPRPAFISIAAATKSTR